MGMTTVITGSASGVGAAIRTHLEKAGDKVIGIDLKHAEIIADLSTVKGRQDATAGVKKYVGNNLDRFVACAGLGLDARPASIISSVNYFGVVDLLDGLFGLLQRGHHPAAVVISSNSGQMFPMGKTPYVSALLAHNEAEASRIINESNDYTLAYCGSKNAVVRAVRHRVVTWGKAGVRLNSVAPGPTLTPMIQRLLDDPVMGPAQRSQPFPLGRFGKPDEIAVIVAFLLSQDASYVHGAVFYADGGQDATIRPDGF